jgi:hypothetical protein
MIDDVVRGDINVLYRLPAGAGVVSESPPRAGRGVAVSGPMIEVRDAPPGDDPPGEPLPRPLPLPAVLPRRAAGPPGVALARTGLVFLPPRVPGERFGDDNVEPLTGKLFPAPPGLESDEISSSGASSKYAASSTE